MNGINPQVDGQCLEMTGSSTSPHRHQSCLVQPFEQHFYVTLP